MEISRRAFDRFLMLPLQRVAEQFSDIVLLLDETARILFLNDSGHRLLGYDPGALYGENWFQCCLPDERKEDIRQVFQTFVTSNPIGDTEAVTHENEVQMKNGRKLMILWRNLTLRDKSGVFAGVLSTGVDVTRYRDDERRLLDLLARQQALFESFPIGITVSDLKGKVLETNRTAEELLGVPREEHNRRCIDDAVWHLVRSDGTIMPPNEFASVRAMHENRVIQCVETGIVRPDESLVWLEVSAAPIQSASGGVVIVYNDISERKREADIMRARERILSAAEGKSLDSLFQQVLDEVEALTGSCIAFGHFLEEDQKTLVLQTWSSHTLKDMCRAEGKGQHYDVDLAGVWVDCIRQRKPVIHNDYEALPHRKGLPAGHAPVLRELVVPVLDGERIVAIIGVGNKPRAYVAEDVDTVVRISRLAWDIVRRKQAEDALTQANIQLEAALVRERDRADTDQLTGLLSRRAIFEFAEFSCAVASRYHQPLSILLIDLDHFKSVNDRFGHASGDAVLAAVARVIRTELRTADHAGRIGGEEFVIVLPVTPVEQAMHLAERVRAQVEKVRVSTGRGDAGVTASIGIARMCEQVPRETHDVQPPASEEKSAVPPVGTDQTAGLSLGASVAAKAECFQSLLHRADSAMYMAKNAGRNRVVVAVEDGIGRPQSVMME